MQIHVAEHLTWVKDFSSTIIDSKYEWDFSVCRHAVHLPISLPDMDGLFIHIVVFQCLLIQEVKEIFDSRWHHCPRAQHAAEEVIHKLLQRSLKGATNNVRQRRDGEQRQKYQTDRKSVV